MLARIWIG